MRKFTLLLFVLLLTIQGHAESVCRQLFLRSINHPLAGQLTALGITVSPVIDIETLNWIFANYLLNSQTDLMGGANRKRIEDLVQPILPQLTPGIHRKPGGKKTDIKAMSDNGFGYDPVIKADLQEENRFALLASMFGLVLIQNPNPAQSSIVKEAWYQEVSQNKLSSSRRPDYFFIMADSTAGNSSQLNGGIKPGLRFSRFVDFYRPLPSSGLESIIHGIRKKTEETDTRNAVGEILGRQASGVALGLDQYSFSNIDIMKKKLKMLTIAIRRVQWKYLTDVLALAWVGKDIYLYHLFPGHFEIGHITPDGKIELTEKGKMLLPSNSI